MISPRNRFWAKLLLLVIVFQAFSLAVFPQQQIAAQTTNNLQPTYTISPGNRITATGGFIVNDTSFPLFYKQNGQWTYASGNNVDTAYQNASKQEIYFLWDASTQVYMFKSDNNSFVNGNSTPTDTDGSPCWTGISVPAGSQTGAQFVGARKDTDKITPGCTQSIQSLIGFGAPVFANLSSGSLTDSYYGINFPVCNQTPGTAAYSACFSERQAAIKKLANSVSCSTTSAAGIAACEYNKSIQSCLSASDVSTASHCMALAQANSIAAGNVSTITAQTTDQQIADLCSNISDPTQQQACVANATKQRDTLANVAPASSTTDNCPLGIGESMRWLGCSIFFTLKGATDALKTQINNYLYADPNTLFGGNAQSAANIFRNIGMVLIVVAGLFMVISQALGFEFLDAYTIRKLMPRLGVALIGMALAWPLLKLSLTLTNDLGGLIDSVFMRLATVASSGSSSADIGTAMGTALTGTVGAAAIAIKLGMAGLLSLLGTVAVALLIGLLVLSIRQLVIFVLVILAPLAIAAYVIPGGQKLWSFWKNTLVTTLFMYPLIMGFISAGAAMAYIMPKDSNSMSLLAIIIYFIPYVMLPFAFKMAGGLMGTIFSLANDKNRGFFDKQKKKREGIREERRGRAENNSLWSKDSRLQKALGANKWASVMTDPYGNLAHAGRNIPGFRKKGASIEASINSQRTQQTGKLFEELNNMFGNNDKAYRLLSGAHSGLGDTTRSKLQASGLYGKQITSLNDLQAAAKILSESEDGAERLAGNAIHNASGRLATLNQDPEMLRADVTAAGMMGLAAHGFASGDDLAYSGNLLRKSGMSAGAAQSLVVQSQVMGVRGRPDLKAGYGIVYNGQTGKFENGMTAPGNQNRAKELIMSLQSGDLAGAKSGALKALTTPIREIIKTGGDAGRAVQEQLFSWAGQYSQASADVKAEALQFIRDNKLDDAFDAYNRTFDPEKTGAGRPPQEEPPKPTPGGGKP